MQRSGGQGTKEGRILAHSRRIMWQEHKEWGVGGRGRSQR